MKESQLPLRFATYLVRHAAKPTRVKPSKPQKRAPETFKPRRSSVADSIKPETLLLDPKDLLAVKPGKSTFTLAEKKNNSGSVVNFVSNIRHLQNRSFPPYPCPRASSALTPWTTRL